MIGRLKALRNKKGFTLVELMIVVAVIGILALVLLPKIGTIKTSAKSAGIDTNMRMVQAVVQSKISDYAGKAGSGENALAYDIVNTLNNGDKMVDPFNSAITGAGILANSLSIPNNNTNEVVLGVAANTNAPYLSLTPGANGSPSFAANANGLVYVSVYDLNNDIVVKLTPYDDNGIPLTNKVVTITP